MHTGTQHTGCRLSAGTLRWVSSEFDRLYRTHSRGLVSRALLDAVLIGCRVTRLAHTLVPQRILNDHAALVTLLHERVGTFVGITERPFSFLISHFSFLISHFSFADEYLLESACTFFVLGYFLPFLLLIY